VLRWVEKKGYSGLARLFARPSEARAFALARAAPTFAAKAQASCMPRVQRRTLPPALFDAPQAVR
jgi:hypothetical protein